jgi:hypothetical protein
MTKNISWGGEGENHRRNHGASGSIYGARLLEVLHEAYPEAETLPVHGESIILPENQALSRLAPILNPPYPVRGKLTILVLNESYFRLFALC